MRGTQSRRGWSGPVGAKCGQTRCLGNESGGGGGPCGTYSGVQFRSRAGRGWCELNWAGVGWAGLDWAGLGWTGLFWAGLSWAGVGWDGLGWAELSWAGLGWTGLD